MGEWENLEGSDMGGHGEDQTKEEGARRSGHEEEKGDHKMESEGRNRHASGREDLQ